MWPNSDYFNLQNINRSLVKALVRKHGNVVVVFVLIFQHTMVKYCLKLFVIHIKEDNFFLAIFCITFYLNTRQDLCNSNQYYFSLCLVTTCHQYYIMVYVQGVSSQVGAHMHTCLCVQSRSKFTNMYICISANNDNNRISSFSKVQFNCYISWIDL